MKEESLERILIISNPKKTMSYRVTVDEDREGKLISLLQSNGYRFTKISEGKQMCLTINLDTIIREEK